MWDMNTVAVVRESVRKEAAWAAHGGGGRDVRLDQVAWRVDVAALSH